MPATHRTVGSVQNYTTAFLVTSGLITFMALFTIAAMKGTIWMLLTAAGLECLIRLRSAFLSSREGGESR